MRRTATVSLLGAHTALAPAPALKARTEDELDGCADETDAAMKPFRPGTNGLKGLHLDGRYVSAADGSLPNTPDPQEFGSAELGRDTRRLLLDFYRTHTGLCPRDRKQHHALPTMTRVVADILLKHEIAYKGKSSACALATPKHSCGVARFLHRNSPLKTSPVVFKGSPSVNIYSGGVPYRLNIRE